MKLFLEELEQIENPGFWQGFRDGLIVGASVVAGIGLGVAIAT